MSNESSPARTPDPDPEIEALLKFEPVARQTRRHDGWSPERQYGFIAALARLGDVDRASHSVGRTASGAWKVRSSAGGEGFSEAWDAALDLFHSRNPLLSRRGGRAVPGARGGAPRRREWEAAPQPDDEDEQDEQARWRDFCDGILRLYRLKLEEEREARLEGRIVEADYAVRQLTFIEVALDLGGLGLPAREMLMALERGGTQALDIVATPMSILLARIRRDCWARWDEPDRPPPPALGDHDGDKARGERIPGETRPGDRRRSEAEIRARDSAEARFHAEAQQAWEEKARADAEAWRERLRAEGYPVPEEGDGEEEQRP